MLDGPSGACEVARDVLEALYSRLEAGGQVNPGDVDGALRHARAGRRAKDEAQAQMLADACQKGRPGEIATRKRVITARTPAQSAYIKALQNCDLVFGTGPAGTGKTYLAVAQAAAMLERGETERLIRLWKQGSGLASCPAICAKRSIRTCGRFTTRFTMYCRRSGFSAAWKQA